jgi:hypothetical protein
MESLAKKNQGKIVKKCHIPFRKFMPKIGSSWTPVQLLYKMLLKTLQMHQTVQIETAQLKNVAGNAQVQAFDSKTFDLSTKCSQ